MMADEPAGTGDASAKSSRLRVRGGRAITCPDAMDLEKWHKPLGKIATTVSPGKGPLPIDCSRRLFSEPVRNQAAPREGAGTVFQWAPTELAYQPLYFDDVPLERYGQTACPALQPILSGAHFFGCVPLMPYKLGIDRAHDPVYTLGYSRPGSDAPCVRQRLPLELDAALFEAGAATGLIFLIP